MWKPEHRIAAERSGLRYPSDLTDAEWALIAPLIPPAKHGGRKRTIDVREVLNGIFYVLWTGCQWQALPKDLPPKSTVWDYFDLWTWDGTLERVHHVLYVAVRERAGREASPTVAIIDSQSAKGAQKGGLARPAGLRCGQEDQGSQAPHSRRYARPLAERGRPSRQRSGSRWCCAGARSTHASFVPLQLPSAGIASSFERSEYH
jgi:transposase